MTQSDSDYGIKGRDEDLAAASWLLVRAGVEIRGLPAADILEISDPQPLTRLPGSPPEVLGMVNHRGTPVPVVDVGATMGRLGGLGKNHRLVLVRWGEHRIGLAVDDTVAFSEDCVAPSGERVSRLDLDVVLDPIF